MNIKGFFKNRKTLCFSLVIAVVLLSLFSIILYNRTNTNKIYKSCVTVYCGTDVSTNISSDDNVVGSGFFCGDGAVMTSYHNLVGTDGNLVKDCYVITYDGVMHKADITYTDPDFDIAILTASNRYPSLKLSDRAPKINESIYSCSTPKSIHLRNTFTQGKITKTSINGLANQYLIMSDMKLSPGCSGSPVVDKHNKVIAMNAFKSTEYGTEGLSFSIYGNKLIDAYNNYKNIINKINKTDNIDYGIEFEASKNAQIGILNTPGITITSITDSSVLKNSRLKTGDTIVAIDNENIYTAADFYEKLNEGSVIEGHTESQEWFKITFQP